MNRPHRREDHKVFRNGWLRAAVLGANDGIVSTASLIAGVGAADASRVAVLTAGLAGLVAGALSMAVGEYVSVKAQADTEAADLRLEARELRLHTERERDELTQIYIERGLSPELAKDVSQALMQHNPLQAHARDELGLMADHRARPVQAAFASAASFSLGAALPVVLGAVAPVAAVSPTVIVGSVVCLAVLGAVSAKIGGAPIARAMLRIAVLGAVAMGVTALVGHLFATL